MEVLRSSPEDGLYKTAFNLTVLVAGLGYFIDTFDFFLCNSMRVVSLTELGLSGDALTKIGIIILNCQIFGALIGGFFWGILGDKIGRKKALIGSILIYSIGMVMNGFVSDASSYELVRFLIGFAVAGEVGIGATLIAETVPFAKRTYALMFFTIMGVLGVVVAGTSIEFVSWRTSCFVGGALGLLLLTLRSMLFESHLFEHSIQNNIRRGSLRDLLVNPKNLKKYLLCIPMLGSNFYVTGIVLTLSPEIAAATQVQGPVKANIALAIYFTVATLGDWLGAWLSEVLKSRRKVAGLFIVGNLCIALFLLQKLHLDASWFYFVCASFGIFNLWAICGTIVVEQFPTELRATASTSNFNFSRATVILMNLSLLALKPTIGFTSGIITIGIVMFSLGLVGVILLDESYGCHLKDL
jgi:MFS family permease